MTDFNTSDRDVTRAIRSWLHEDRHEDASRIAAAVLDRVEATPRRRPSWWPARREHAMNKPLAIGLGMAAVIVALVAGTQLLGRPAPAGVGTTQGTASASAPVATASAAPSPTGAVGGTVHYQLDGAATTEIDAVADGESVSGTAITTLRAGTHTVRLGCATRDGDTWALGGKTERSTIKGEPVGTWSAVIVKEGSPQQIAIWFSGDAPAGSDCDGFLASHDFASLGPEEFSPVGSGALVPVADLVP